MKKIFFCVAVVLGITGCALTKSPTVMMPKKNEMVYKYFSVPAKRGTQAVRVDLSKLQNYFASQKLKFAMMDNLRQDSAVLALDTSKRLTIFDPSIQQNIGYIKIRYARTKFKIACVIVAQKSEVCESPVIEKAEFLDSDTVGPVQVEAFAVHHN
ncbi:MAG TPA: hypothetical protein VJK30_00050 [Coxiellaceae bacterium]|nr:MAG: hypothetical protein A3E81_00045 [Gammaproteobacteria bacterium RIFCSPHIGHO2_12_FULL_36_30]HLB55707.1 hypothetical protein [Coxiellaceae bacterium]